MWARKSSGTVLDQLSICEVLKKYAPQSSWCYGVMVSCRVGCMILGKMRRREIIKELRSTHATHLMLNCQVDCRVSSEYSCSMPHGFVDQCPPFEPLFRIAEPTVRHRSFRQLVTQCNTRYTTMLQVGVELMTSGTCKVIEATNYIQTRTSLSKKTKLRGRSPQAKLYRPSDRRLSPKLVPSFAGRGCCVVSATNSHGR
jgi:hypothetical protein